ncbi:hypothetical protein IDJ77_04170 [Mucilaginibacter sp. ZT4R22]|uniref:Putative endonuclease Z1 domain-containing protein n=1 Tax=Mucilaginibacter pankratovii TaxID=2772110 RepID=A0ABR7WKZ4_9SPHI|nr:Z1 domain-containing protein [Mucilaginibacter pankratovii]MBD1362998.1 hypothetical protein [Mucilaginibacter pankratovii]
MNELEKKVNDRHEESMEFAEMAFSARRRKEYSIYCKLIQKALNLEKAAARSLEERVDVEPSRSVLYQSAAYLALNLDAFDEAEQLVKEAMQGKPPVEIAEELKQMQQALARKKQIRKNVLQTAEGFLEMADETNIDDEALTQALEAAFRGFDSFSAGNIDSLLNRIAVEVSFRGKHKVNAPDYQIFDREDITDRWTVDTDRAPWSFWKFYKEYLHGKNMPVPVIKKLDQLTDDILTRLGNPAAGGSWDKRGMIVGDVQSGKTGNYIGLINKAADAGYRIIIVLSGLYENLRKQTQLRVDEGFTGKFSQSQTVTGTGVYRKSNLPPVHTITHSGSDGDIKMRTLRNNPLNTNDYYALVIKKNPTVLKSLLSWFVNSPNAVENNGSLIIRNIPVLVIDDEADYASLNISKDSASTINACIRALLGLFDQSAFIGYTATPFANVFIDDINQTAENTLDIGGKKIKLCEDLFPRDFIINLPPPSNYIGYQKVFRTTLEDPESETEGNQLSFVNFIEADSPEIPADHRKNDDLPEAIPHSLKRAVCCFILVCAIRMARGQERDHNSMLVHISWYIRWINKIAELTNDYLTELRNLIRYDESFLSVLHDIWLAEFAGKSEAIMAGLGYDDPRVMENSWNEIIPYLSFAAEKIEVRAVHGPQKGLSYTNTAPLDYEEHPDGLWVIAVGGNKLSRGLTLESLSISYFLRATRFYDTLLQMGRWFGYRPGYADLCRLFTTEDLVLWYQYIAKAAEDLKDQFDIMELAERKPRNYGLKVWKAPGKILLVSSPAKTRSGTDLDLSYSGELLETYLLSKSPQILQKNLDTAASLMAALGQPSGITRQGQHLIWENAELSVVDGFINNYSTGQANISPAYLRAYFAAQAAKNNLTNWTIVLISNSNDENPHLFDVNGADVAVGRTRRQERSFKDKDGKEYTRQDTYWIRKSHIISPPHEYLDMDDQDSRFTEAKRAAAEVNTKAVGKFVRKYRGAKNALLLIYILDPAGFGGTDVPATGYAISLPVVTGDEPISYLANPQFVKEINELFHQPDDAGEELPDDEEEAK